MDPTATLAIIFIFVFSIVFISKGSSLIKTWINRKKPIYDQEKFDRLAKAFIQYKKRSEHQIERLETELRKLGHKSTSKSTQPVDKGQSNKSIEIEPDQPKRQAKTSSGKMENMLRDRV